MRSEGMLRNVGWRLEVAGVIAAVCGNAVAVEATEPEQPPAAVHAVDATARERLREAVTWLAAPDREGRGPGTAGITAAADWVARQFAAAGLDTTVIEQEPFQSFAMTLEATLGPAADNIAEIIGPPDSSGTPQRIVLALGEDFTPLAAGGSGGFDLPLAFGGFGITAPKEGYDDYASLPDRGKGAAVIVLRQEPQKDNPHSVFDGNQASQHAALARKVANASEHEAGGIVFCNDVAEGDGLMSFTRAGEGSEKRSLPILHVKRHVIDDVVQRSLGRDVAAIQQGIDEKLVPASATLDGWRIRGRIAIDRTETQGRNVLAILPGAGAATAGDQPAIDPRETVVLGAHYDHLGYGGSNSAAPGEKAIHHGADDNASGTALLVEVARRLKEAGPLPRSVLFAAFSGEERGLLGSGHYAANPAVPLGDTVAMINLDMVGRLVDDKIIVHGTGTGTGLEQLVDRLVAARGFGVAKEAGGFGPSDHSSFYAKKIPVLHLFTGSHADYHRPTDTAEKINYDGMVRIAGLVADIVRELATSPEKPAYIEVASTMFARGGGDRPYFGSIPDFGKPGKGYAISGVTKDSPAAKGGLQGGDLIVRVGESAITGLEDFDSALRKHKGGETVKVIVVRAGAEVPLDVTLGQPR
jgi:acetylornithine deacetylase/succinyl-diaminopimelate desuccinylase-like protein